VVDGYQSGNDVSGSGEFSDRWNFFGNPQDFQPSPTGIPFFLTGTPTVPNDPAYAINNPACTAHASTDVLQYACCYQDGNPVMTPPEFGFFGTMRRNIFRGPGYHNWDFSVTKMWTFQERFSVQLLGEFFNILNHPNFTTEWRGRTARQRGSLGARRLRRRRPHPGRGSSQPGHWQRRTPRDSIGIEVEVLRVWGGHSSPPDLAICGPPTLRLSGGRLTRWTGEAPVSPFEPKRDPYRTPVPDS